MLVLVGVGIISFLLGVIVTTYWLLPKMIVGMVMKLANEYVNSAKEVYAAITKEKDDEDQIG